MTQNFNNEVMNQTIVRLNEFKAVKMASLSKSKRPAAKFNKEVANYLLTNWNDVEALKTCLDTMRRDMPKGCEEVMNIYSERIGALEPKQAEVKPEVSLTDGERSALRIFFNSIESENGFHMDEVHEVAKQYGYSKKAMVGYSSALSEKGLLDMYADMDCYFDGELTAAGMEIAETISDEQIIKQEKSKKTSVNPTAIKRFSELKGKFPKKIILLRCGDFYETYNEDAVECAKILGISLTESGDGVKTAGFPHHALDEYLPKLIRAGKTVGITDPEEAPKQTNKQRITETVGKTATSNNKRKSGISKTRKVGDRHPNGLWVWTEYKEGKFDWRIDPAIKRKPGRKGGITTNQSKKKEVAGKAEKAEPAAAPKLTLEELLNKSIPQGLSKPQKAVVKALKKGYRLRKDGDNLWLTDSNGNNERVEKNVLTALQRKYKIDYIPEGLRYNK